MMRPGHFSKIDQLPRKYPMIKIDLAEFEVSAQRGFLPLEDPLAGFPGSHAAWDEAAHELPKILMTGRVRTWLKSVPQLSVAGLQGRACDERAMLILSYLGHAWVWGEEAVSDRLPANIAVPWFEVAQRLERPPVLSYASHALRNWRRLDQEAPIELGNTARLLNFFGGLDEEWFVLVHIAIEAQAGPAASAAVRLQRCVVDRDQDGALESLRTLSSVLMTIRSILERMPEKCDPYVYFLRVRPFIFGWMANPALPQGVFYDGVSRWEGRPQKFRGETGAQSSIVPTVDAVLGLGFKGNPEFAQHLEQLRDYMPGPHRRFIAALERNEKEVVIRDFIEKHRAKNPALADAYNATLEELVAFRRTHLSFAGSYIARQANKVHNPTAAGTGGTPFMTYLHDHVEQTLAHRF
jgi:indoleamine 2,3-dioxygenase